jgi:PhnB protein
MSTDAGTGTSVVCSVAPMLSVRNGARAGEFYKSAFGAIEVYRVEDPGGSVVSRLSIDVAEFWLSDESPEHGNFSPESLGGGSARMILTVPDPDAMFAKALGAGAQEVFAVEEAYGWRLAAWSIHSAITGRSGIRSRRRSVDPGSLLASPYDSRQEPAALRARPSKA